MSRYRGHFAAIRVIPRAHQRSSVFVEVFFGHVVLWHLARVDFSPFVVIAALDTCYDAGFESVSFSKQFVDAL